MVRAIARNPTAFAERTIAMLCKLPQKSVHVYSMSDGTTRHLGTGAVLFGLALLGAVALFRGARPVLLLCFLWVMPLMVYWLTWFREGYFGHYFIVVYTLAALGLARLVRRGARRFAVVSGVIVLVGLLSVAMATNLPRLCAGADRREPSASEKAVLVLRDTLPEGSWIGAWAPAVPLAANMQHALMIVYMDEYTDADFSAWLDRYQVRAIYVDRKLRECEPHVTQLVEAQVGRRLREIFREVEARLYLVDGLAP